MKHFSSASENSLPVYRVLAQDVQWRVVDVPADSSEEAIRIALTIPQRRFRKVNRTMNLVGICRMDKGTAVEYFDEPEFYSPNSHEELL